MAVKSWKMAIKNWKMAGRYPSHSSYLPVLIIFTTNQLRHFWKIWQIFSRTHILYLQDYIYEICSELTIFAVESPTR